MKQKPLKLVTAVCPEYSPFTHFLVNGVIQTRDTCIKEIDNKQFEYRTSPQKGKGRAIHVVRPENSEPYLRTDNNQTTIDNLTELPAYFDVRMLQRFADRVHRLGTENNY